LKFRDGRSEAVRIAERGGRTLRLQGCESPEAARRFTNTELWIERGDAPGLPKGSHYAADLVGKTVVDARRGELGKVAGLIETGSNACLEIQPAKGESWLIPMTDEVIQKIDEAVHVTLLPGLHPDETEEA
jgi:16S rRNA processing protein RimM